MSQFTLRRLRAVERRARPVFQVRVRSLPGEGEFDLYVVGEGVEEVVERARRLRDALVGEAV
jgi:hypothetical protein